MCSSSWDKEHLSYISQNSFLIPYIRHPKVHIFPSIPILHISYSSNKVLFPVYNQFNGHQTTDIYKPFKAFFFFKIKKIFHGKFIRRGDKKWRIATRTSWIKTISWFSIFSSIFFLLFCAQILEWNSSTFSVKVLCQLLLSFCMNFFDQIQKI